MPFQIRLRNAVEKIQGGSYDQQSKPKNFLSINSQKGKNVPTTQNDKEKGRNQQSSNASSSGGFSSILFGSADDNQKGTHKQRGSNNIGNVKKNDLNNDTKGKVSEGVSKTNDRNQRSILLSNDNKNTPKFVPDEKEEKSRLSTNKYFPERMSRVFSLPTTTSFSTSFRSSVSTSAVANTTAAPPSPSSSSSSYFHFSSPSKESPIKLTENVQDASDVLTLLEICLMHGMRIKEFHGTLPLWTLLERLRLLSHQGIADMDVINNNNNNNDRNDKKEKKNNILSTDNDKNRNKNLLNIVNYSGSGNNNNNNKNENKVKSINKNDISSTTDSLPDVLRWTLTTVAAISSLKTSLAKSRAWIRYENN